MTTSSVRKRMVMGMSLVLVVGMLLAVLLSGAFAAAPAAHPGAPLVVASGSTQQWAFGGNASAAYSCSSTACGDGTNITSLSLHYYIGWVVIYTATNISSTQTEFEAQAAINASLSLSITGSALSATANLAGRETASGFTNVTNTGTVNLTAGPGSPGNVAALALMNAESKAAFNFSLSFSATITNATGTNTESENFDLGGNETSTVNFPSPLGVVPIDPQQGQWWNASAPYSATGAYTSGYSVSANINGHSYSGGDWASLSISPSGTLTVNGTDLGPATLTDGYTNPPTTVTVQEILLSFSNGEFTGSDGWVMLPSGLYGGALGGLGGLTLVAGQHPSAVSVPGGEAAYYQKGPGFVGVDEAANSSSVGLSTGPQVNLKAGPEPVTVAQQQYSAITSPSGGGSSAFPTTILILAVVVVVVVIIGVLVMVRRPGRRRPSTDAPPPMPTGSYAGWVPPPAPPSPPGGEMPPPPAPPGA